MDSERYRINNHGIHSLWINWAVSVGVITLLMPLGLLIGKMWLPAAAIGLEFVLMVRMRENDDVRDDAMCRLLPYLVTRILLITALIMVSINLYIMKFVDPLDLAAGLVNRKIPYITVLIVAPVTALVSVWAYLRQSRMPFCRMCRRRYGQPAERGFLGQMFDRESTYQLRVLMWLSLLMSVAGWTYYFVFYRNVNFNLPDRFFFQGVPIAVYLLSLIYMGMRYFSLSTFYKQNIRAQLTSRGSSTLVRYLLLCGDYVFLGEPSDGENGKVDTPALVYLPFRERFTMYDADTGFKDISGWNHKVDMRYLYENSNYFAECNIFHYVVFLDNMSLISDTRFKGAWHTLAQLEKLMHADRVSEMLTTEIRRLYTITMARKTYDINGRRLYDVKNYKPTFRLRDLGSIDVDFNDPVWLHVARNNEDRPFFRLRKLWLKYIKGFEL